MSPGPKLPAPLSKTTRTRGVCTANSFRASATVRAWVKRMAGSGACAETLEAKLANSSSTEVVSASGRVGTLSAT